MAKVILVRHGHPLVEGEDPRQWHLSDQGREIARALSREPIWEPVSTIYSSPEPKARETALVVAEERGLPVKVLEDLGEVRRPYEAGDYEDRIRAFLKGRAPPGWETREAAEGRIWRAMTEVSKGAAQVGVVSHGLLLTLFIAGVMGAKPTYWLHHAIGFAEYALYDTDTRTLMRGFGGGDEPKPAE
ncbi:MAG: histidine phosphatase family protein [Thermoplasmata archaeon]